MKAVYKILNSQDKLTMKHFYHIRRDPDLYKGFCACTGCVETIFNPWLTNLYKTVQSRDAIKPKTCKYPKILNGYNKLYISKFTFF